MQLCFNPIMIHAVVLFSKKILFVLFLMLPRFAQTLQISTHDLLYCLMCADSSPDFVFFA
jgi:hypothetical protein